MYALDCGDYTDILSWSENGDFFTIYDRGALEQRVLPEIFKQAKCSSFLRKLYRWGFTRRRGSASSSRQDDAYINPNFRRGDYDACRSIRCSGGNISGEAIANSVPRANLPSLGVSSSITVTTHLSDQRQGQQHAELQQMNKIQQGDLPPQQIEMQSQLDLMYRQLEEQLLRHRLLQQRLFTQVNGPSITSSSGAHSSSHAGSSNDPTATNVMNTGTIGASIMSYNFNQGASTTVEGTSSGVPLLTGSRSSFTNPSSSAHLSAPEQNYSNSMIAQSENNYLHDDPSNMDNKHTFFDDRQRNGNQPSSFFQQFPEEYHENRRQSISSLSSRGESNMSHAGISGALASGEYSLQQLGLGGQQLQFSNPYLQLHNQHQLNSLHTSSGQMGQQQLNSLHTSSGQMGTSIGDSGTCNERSMLDDDIKGYEEEMQKSQIYK